MKLNMKTGKLVQPLGCWRDGEISRISTVFHSQKMCVSVLHFGVSTQDGTYTDNGGECS